MMQFVLPKLSYAYNSLEPHIDGITMKIHHTKHHQAYIDKLNGALDKYPALQGKKITELLMNLDSLPEEIRTAVRNYGGGHFNHSLFWEVLTDKKTEPKNMLIREINLAFGNLDEFKRKFSEVAINIFGSGWAWFVVDKGKLKIMSTANQDCPIMKNMKPILCLDVWEHAYYLKYQNRRTEYVSAFWNVVNWEKVEELYRLNNLIELFSY